MRTTHSAASNSFGWITLIIGVLRLGARTWAPGGCWDERSTGTGNGNGRGGGLAVVAVRRVTKDTTDQAMAVLAAIFGG